eukprot:2262492-Pleurochrysis_carterae.AAC.1
MRQASCNLKRSECNLRPAEMRGRQFIVHSTLIDAVDHSACEVVLRVAICVRRNQAYVLHYLALH